MANNKFRVTEINVYEYTLSDAFMEGFDWEQYIYDTVSEGNFMPSESSVKIEEIK